MVLVGSNIEVGGAGEAAGQRLAHEGSVIFALPGIKTFKIAFLRSDERNWVPNRNAILKRAGVPKRNALLPKRHGYQRGLVFQSGVALQRGTPFPRGLPFQSGAALSGCRLLQPLKLSESQGVATWLYKNVEPMTPM